jgi:hypothetical protein
VPGVVSLALPRAFTRPAAYGDLLTTIIALLAIAALKTRPGTILVWVINIVGLVDLIYALSYPLRVRTGLEPGLLGAAYFIPILPVPLLVITHVFVFRILLRGEAAITTNRLRQVS